MNPKHYIHSKWLNFMIKLEPNWGQDMTGARAGIEKLNQA